jgi:hypothetical protein
VSVEEEPLEEETESIEEESRLRWAVRKAFIPPAWSPLQGGGGGESRDNRKRDGTENQELVERYSAHPSLLKDLCALAFKLAERGYFARVRVIRVRDLAPAKLLPPFLLEPLSEKIVRLELEVERS